MGGRSGEVEVEWGGGEGDVCFLVGLRRLIESIPCMCCH